ncbi:hypothetical protein [Brevibacillus marinus]|uniref:hypothetical protein n=1 Tax=Brevibacillus marinus TaxID=2496837 RepID=UPI000F834FEF|nr:hypothetical protein [Brevibacillus marinus]
MSYRSKRLKKIYKKYLYRPYFRKWESMDYLLKQLRNENLNEDELKRVALQLKSDEAILKWEHGFLMPLASILGGFILGWCAQALMKAFDISLEWNNMLQKDITPEKVKQLSSSFRTVDILTDTFITGIVMFFVIYLFNAVIFINKYNNLIRLKEVVETLLDEKTKK